MTAAFVSPRVPLVDVRTGLITREWFLLLQSLFNLGGGGVPDDQIDLLAPASGLSDDLATALAIVRDEAMLVPVQIVSPPPGDDLTPPSVPLFFAADDVLPVINGLRDEVAQLRARIDDMQKGTVTL